MHPIFILFVASVIALVSGMAAWWYVERPANYHPRNELMRLRNHAAWLEQRLDLARRERWGHDMIVSLSEQLGVACQQLARAQRRGHRKPAASPR